MKEGKERGAIFELADVTCPVTVEEIAGLVEHLPHDHEDIKIRSASKFMAIVLDQLMRSADGLAPDVYLPETLKSESAVLSLAIFGWIDEVGYSNLPPRIQQLRDALWLEEVTRAGIRDVRFVFQDGRWKHERSVPVAGDPFWQGGRLWAIRYVTAEHDESGEIIHWTVCGERQPPRSSLAE